jgi:hypothetical protein
LNIPSKPINPKLRWSMLVPDRELFIRHQDPSLCLNHPVKGTTI